jgi:hypothetical protein
MRPRPYRLGRAGAAFCAGAWVYGEPSVGQAASAWCHDGGLTAESRLVRGGSPTRAHASDLQICTWTNVLGPPQAALAVWGQGFESPQLHPSGPAGLPLMIFRQGDDGDISPHMVAAITRARRPRWGKVDRHHGIAVAQRMRRSPRRLAAGLLTDCGAPSSGPPSRTGRASSSPRRADPGCSAGFAAPRSPRSGPWFRTMCWPAALMGPTCLAGRLIVEDLRAARPSGDRPPERWPAPAMLTSGEAGRFPSAWLRLASPLPAPE